MLILRVTKMTIIVVRLCVLSHWGCLQKWLSIVVRLCIFFNRVAVNWRSLKNITTTGSIIEVEYITLSDATNEAVIIKSVIHVYGHDSIRLIN